MSSIKSPSIGGSTYWGIIIDDYTKFKWSIFLKTKGELSEKGAHLLYQINKVHQIKCIHMDNVGENRSLQQVLQSSCLNIHFEFTNPDTPQQNGVAERGLASIKSNVKAMMFSANCSPFYMYKLWAECVSLATFLDNHKIWLGNDKSSYQLFHGANKMSLPNIPFGAPVIMRAGKVGFRKKWTDADKSVSSWASVPIIHPPVTELSLIHI